MQSRDDVSPSETDDDPDGPVDPDAGFFGFDMGLDESKVRLIPVPWEATASYRLGTADGPEAMRRASHQVDLLDPHFGDLRDRGWTMVDAAIDIRALSDRALARARADDVSDVHRRAVDADFERVMDAVTPLVDDALAADRVPIVLGGDHSVALPGLRCRARHAPDCAVLQVDAHADLRRAYEGFRYSHASVMRQLLDDDPGLRLVQLGVRDLCREEGEVIASEHDRVRTFFDRDLADARLQGTVPHFLDDVVEALPDRVWLSLDIDGLDPAWCPSTGTPVPGGLRWEEMVALLERLAARRQLIGADLVEVSPGRPAPEGDSWDAIVGARLLYKIMGAAVGATRPPLPSASR